MEWNAKEKVAEDWGGQEKENTALDLHIGKLWKEESNIEDHSQTGKGISNINVHCRPFTGYMKRFHLSICSKQVKLQLIQGIEKWPVPK